jgi:hypothetical protein
MVHLMSGGLWRSIRDEMAGSIVINEVYLKKTSTHC